MSAPVASLLSGEKDEHLEHPGPKAWGNVETAVVNIALSVALIQRFGLPGVAVVTLPPPVSAAAFVLLPATWRRIGLPVVNAVRETVRPAAWRAIIECACLPATRPLVPAGLLPPLCQVVVSCLPHEVLFFACAVPREGRAFYRTNVLRLGGRYRNLPAAA
jgi:hypothetical protein